MTSIVEFPKPKLVENTPPEVCEEFIRHLERVLDQAKKGKVIAAAMVEIDEEGRVGNWYYDYGAVYYHELISGAGFLVRRIQDEVGEWEHTSERET